MFNPIVVSYGGGDNSRAMLIAMVQRSVRPDLILFADTAGERPETYANNAEFCAWLEMKGFPPITVVKDGRKTLEQEVLEGNTLPSVAFGFKSCSDKYKIRPQNRFIAEWAKAKEVWALGGKVVKFVGYDINEGARAKDYDDSKFLIRYPLRDWGWDRVFCSKLVKEAGFSPSKSACFYCPNSKPREILDLASKHPDLFKRAVEMERNASIVTTVKGLGRNWSWEGLVAADRAQMKMFEDDSEPMPCGCFDAA